MSASALALCALFAAATPAAPDGATATAAKSNILVGQPDPEPPFKALAVLLGLVACGAGALIYVKKFKNQGVDTGRSIEIIASKTLSPKVRVVLIRTDGRDFLLSVGTEGAALISEWTEQTADLMADRSAADLEREMSPEPDPDPVVLAPRAMQPAALAEDWSPAVSGLLNLRRNSRSEP